MRHGAVLPFDAPRILGRTGVKVGRLGVAGGYGAPAAALEMAFERGCNYFYHGSFRRKGMTEAIRNISAKGKRGELLVVAQIYTRWLWQFRRSLRTFLGKTGLAQADVLLLGWYKFMPPEGLLDLCFELKEKGMYRFLGISGHHRPAFQRFAESGIFDVFQIRYNAGHRGAEGEVFQKLKTEDRPGIVTYTATRWGTLLNPRKVPEGEEVPRPEDCYRFVLTNPDVDVCMTGPKSIKEMEVNLRVLESGPMSDEELSWMRRVGDHVSGKNRRT